MSKPLVIYHGNCADGFTAAWLANMHYSIRAGGPTKPDDWVVEPHAAVYGASPPDVNGRVVIILDFSYPREVMQRIRAEASAMLWIDHHVSAIQDCEGLAIAGLRSVDRSGAYLTSQWFFPDSEPEEMVKLVDDRDRWVFRDTRTKAFHAGLFSRPYAIGEWNRLSWSVRETTVEGEGILRKHWKDIRELLDVCSSQGPGTIAGRTVWIANLPYTMASDACHELLERHPETPFAACWYLRADGKMVFSLRSRNDSDVDVAAIAKLFGGGGHKHAAGFAVREWPGRPT